MAARSCPEAAAAAAAVVAEALSWVGTPYRHQAALKGLGCDCLGLVRGVWRALYGGELERPGPYAPDWAEAGGAETLLEGVRRHFGEYGKPRRSGRPSAVPLEAGPAGQAPRHHGGGRPLHPRL